VTAAEVGRVAVAVDIDRPLEAADVGVAWSRVLGVEGLGVEDVGSRRAQGKGKLAKAGGGESTVAWSDVGVERRGLVG